MCVGGNTQGKSFLVYSPPTNLGDIVLILYIPLNITSHTDTDGSVVWDDVRLCAIDDEETVTD